MSEREVIWITGASGFSGRHLIDLIRRQEPSALLIGLDIRENTDLTVDELCVVDLNEVDALSSLAQRTKPSRVFHLAGLIPPAPNAAMWQVNVQGTESLLRSLRDVRERVPRIVSIGSAAEYTPSQEMPLGESSECGGGRSEYGRTKWLQSRVALDCGSEWGLPVMVARTFNLIGPGLPPALLPAALCNQFTSESPEVHVRSLDGKRDFIDIRDAVAAYWQICESGVPGEVYNVCRGIAASVEDLIEFFQGCSVTRKAIVAGTPSQDGTVDCVYGNPGRLASLGWKPQISLQESIRDMMAQAGPAQVL